MLIICLGLGVTGMVIASDAPRYKPLSRAEPVDISTAAYGASPLAPRALSIGEIAPDFTVATVSGMAISLSDFVVDGPVVIVFYRGHW